MSILVLAILGASGHGKVIADLAEQIGYQCVFFDDAWPNKDKVGHRQIVGDTDALIQRLPEFNAVSVAIGHNATREQKQRLLISKSAVFPVLIHPHASVSRYAKIGAGTVVFAGAVINADADVGQGVILNTGCTIDHDCVVGDFSHISPGVNLAGGVKVGMGAWLGIGSVAKQLITIGKGAVVGMGAVVNKDVPADVTVIGNPARPLVKN